MKPTHPVRPTRPSDARQEDGARRGGKGEGSQRIPPSPWGRRTQGRGRNKEKDCSYPLFDMTSAQSSGRASLCACRPRDTGWQGGRCSSEACGLRATLGVPHASASSKQSNPHSFPHRHGRHSSPPRRAGSPTTCATSAHQLTGHVAESHRVLSRKTCLKNRCKVPMGALQRRCPKKKT